MNVKQSQEQPKKKKKKNLPAKLKIKPNSLTAIMLDPKMKSLRQTWMGSYYIKQIQEMQKRLRNAGKPKKKAAAKENSKTAAVKE